MPMPYPGSVGNDVQCRDVSQSSQSKCGKSKAGTKNNCNNSTAASTASVAGGGTSGNGGAAVNNKVQQQSTAVAVGAAAPVANAAVDTKPTDTKAVETKSVDNKSNCKTFMKPDTYQRTLEYVQQCQSWSSTVVKEEVTSTTDQKPKLNPNGTVAGYTGPGSQGPLNPSLPQQPTPQPTPTPQPPTQGASRFATPLPVALTETSNMVINDMTSSLTSLQEENKYLQMMQ